MRLFLSAALLLAASTASAEIVDMRSPEFRQGTEHLAQTHQAINRAIQDLKSAEKAYEFPGIDIVRMIGQLQEINETLTLILVPETRRLRYQTLVPDTTFFKPLVRTGE